MASSMAQMAQSTTKGMPGAGSSAGSTLQSFATQGLTFAAIAGGGMFAGPAMGIASGMMGGMMGGHRGMPTTTYIWALPFFGYKIVFQAQNANDRIQSHHGP